MSRVVEVDGRVIWDLVQATAGSDEGKFIGIGKKKIKINPGIVLVG